MSIKGSFKISVDEQDNVSITIGVTEENLQIVTKNTKQDPNGKGTFKVKWESGKVKSQANGTPFHLCKIGPNSGNELLNNKQYNFVVKVWSRKTNRPSIERYRKLKSQEPIIIKSDPKNDTSSPTLIYGIQDNGDLLLYKHSVSNSWKITSLKIGHGWNNFKQVIAGGSGFIYAIQSNGDMLLYKHIGDTAYNFNPSGLKIGHGWNFKQVFASNSNYIFGILSNGDMLLYKFNKDNNSFSISGLKIGHGWNFKQVLIGENNLIFAILENGDMLLYKFNEDNNSFSISGEKIGHGWNFKQIISGNNNQIFAILENGDMLLYKFEETNKSFSISGEKIGNGWNFEQVFSRYS